MRGKVLIALSTFAENGSAPLDLLLASGRQYVLNPYGRRLVREEVANLGADCAGVVAGVEPYDAPVLDGMPHLRCISRVGVGVDNIDLALAAERRIEVRNTPDVVVAPVAELTLAMALDLLKRLTAHTCLLKAGRWEKLTGNMLEGRVVGLVGLGRIGRRVAEVLRALGAEVIGCDPGCDPAWASSAGVALVPLEGLLSAADVVSLHLAVPKDVAFRLGEAELGLMKPGALLVNVARGAYVDEDALFDALSSGRLGGAALDVFPEEPYHGRLATLDNVVLTPHVATLTQESRLRMETEAVANLLDCLDELGA